MQNKDIKFELKIDYERIKLEKMIYRIIGKMIFLLSIGMGVGLFIYNIIIILGPSFESWLFSINILFCVLIIIFSVIAAIFMYFGYQKSPICIGCKQKTKYLENIDQFYCKSCNKYY